MSQPGTCLRQCTARCSTSLGITRAGTDSEAILVDCNDGSRNFMWHKTRTRIETVQVTEGDHFMRAAGDCFWLFVGMNEVGN